MGSWKMIMRRYPLRDGLLAHIQWHYSSWKAGSSKRLRWKRRILLFLLKTKAHNTPVASCFQSPFLIPSPHHHPERSPAIASTSLPGDKSRTRPPVPRSGSLNPVNMEIYLTPLSSHINLRRLESARPLTQEIIKYYKITLSEEWSGIKKPQTNNKIKQNTAKAMWENWLTAATFLHPWERYFCCRFKDGITNKT